MPIIAIVDPDMMSSCLLYTSSDTIEENIKMGNRSTMQMDEIKSAAASAQASSFIEKMEMCIRDSCIICIPYKNTVSKSILFPQSVQCI